MFNWFKSRLEIIKLILLRQKLVAILGLLLIVKLGLDLVSPAKIPGILVRVSALIPWYAWLIGWLALLVYAFIEYSLERKEVFDRTSLNFFKAFLEFLINQGKNLFNDAEDKNFYSKVKFWQEQVIQGIAIGLGPEEAEKYFQKMDSQNSVTTAYKESMSKNTNEPLCRALQANVEELKAIHLNLSETRTYERGELEGVKGLKMVNEPKPEGKEETTALRIRG
jgi:hypothetical protein